MGTVDKMKDKAQEVKGGTKAGVGAATGDRSMETEGKMDKAGANLKQAGEKIKDAAKS
ncbi:MAG TPA: CsbD family protein [Acidimicrobiales bacterium]|nr:CsbD family protein [Acidimicrobiales bacterium]